MPAGCFFAGDRKSLNFFKKTLKFLHKNTEIVLKHVRNICFSGLKHAVIEGIRALEIKMKFGKKVLFPLILGFLLSSCASMNETAVSYSYDSDIGKASPASWRTKDQSKVRVAAEIFERKIMLLSSQLTSNLKEYDPEMKSLVVTTFVDMDDLSQTSRFGRYASERLVHEMHRAGYRVFEIRQSKNIEILEEKGEFHITRKSAELLNRYRSDAVIVGTYTCVNGELTLHARMLERDTSRVVSVAALSFHMNEDPYTEELLGTGRKPGFVVSIDQMEAE